MLLQWSKDSRDKGGNLNGTKQKSYLGQNSGVCHSRCNLACGDDFHPMDEDASQVGIVIFYYRYFIIIAELLKVIN